MNDPTARLRISEYFRTSFGGEPDVIASAAGRVNLIGEHEDYNGGEVLPMAIERRTRVAVRRRTGGQSVAVSMNEAARGGFDAEQPAPARRWWDYVAGVADALRQDGVALPQMEIAVMSDVPEGAGVSSSAALEVAAATAFAALSDTTLTLEQLARAAWRAETEFVGVPCGIMDQFACALGCAGHALHIWCETEQVEHVPFTESVLVFDTGVQRSLRSSEFQLRRAQCDEAFRLLKRANPSFRNLASATRAEILAAELPEPLGRRALHVSDEVTRVQRAVAALRAGEPIPGELMYESHESLRLLFDCSTPELDWFVDQAARIPGVRGARLTGAGWGGCAIAVGETSALLDAAERLPPMYQTTFGHTPRCWLTRAGVGARRDAVR